MLHAKKNPKNRLFDNRIERLTQLMREHPKNGCSSLLAKMRALPIFGDWGYRTSQWLLKTIAENRITSHITAHQKDADILALRKLVKEHPKADLVKLLALMKEHPLLKKWADRSSIWLLNILQCYNIRYSVKNSSKATLAIRVAALKKLIVQNPKCSFKQLLSKMRKKPLFYEWRYKKSTWLKYFIYDNNIYTEAFSKDSEKIQALRKLVEEDHPEADLAKLLALMNNEPPLRTWGSKSASWLSTILKKYKINYISKGNRGKRGVIEGKELFKMRIGALKNLIKKYSEYSDVQLLSKIKMQPIFGSWRSKSATWLLQCIEDNNLSAMRCKKSKEDVEKVRKLVEKEHPEANLAELLVLMKSDPLLTKWSNKSVAWLSNTLRQYQINYIPKSNRGISKKLLEKKEFFRARITALKNLLKKDPKYSLQSLLSKMKKEAIFGNWANKSPSWLRRLMRDNKIRYGLRTNLTAKKNVDIEELHKLVEKEHPEANLFELLAFIKKNPILKKWGNRTPSGLFQTLKKYHIQYISKNKWGYKLPKTILKDIKELVGSDRPDIDHLVILMKQHPRLQKWSRIDRNVLQKIVFERIYPEQRPAAKPSVTKPFKEDLHALDKPSHNEAYLSISDMSVIKKIYSDEYNCDSESNIAVDKQADSVDKSSLKRSQPNHESFTYVPQEDCQMDILL